VAPRAAAVRHAARRSASLAGGPAPRIRRGPAPGVACPRGRGRTCKACKSL